MFRANLIVFSVLKLPIYRHLFVVQDSCLLGRRQANGTMERLIYMLHFMRKIPDIKLLVIKLFKFYGLDVSELK